jgi:hypothetical protein
MSAYLNNVIELYLNDIADFNDSNLLIAESVFKSVKQLLTEGKNQEEILLEVYKKSTPEQKDILEDFFLYIKEGEL